MTELALRLPRVGVRFRKPKPPHPWAVYLVALMLLVASDAFISLVTQEWFGAAVMLVIFAYLWPKVARAFRTGFQRMAIPVPDAWAWVMLAVFVFNSAIIWTACLGVRW